MGAQAMCMEGVLQLTARLSARQREDFLQLPWICSASGF